MGLAEARTVPGGLSLGPREETENPARYNNV